MIQGNIHQFSDDSSLKINTERDSFSSLCIHNHPSSKTVQSKHLSGLANQKLIAPASKTLKSGAMQTNEQMNGHAQN